MKLSPDQIVFWEYGFVTINLTIVMTWVLMLILVVTAALVTRQLKTDMQLSRWQCFLEMVVTGINQQIKEVGLPKPSHFIGFIGTLFLFIAFANVCTIFPWYESPMGSLSTTTALAICVLLSVPFYGIQKGGFLGYLKTYIEPTPIMLPFNIIGEVSRTLALAIRLFGNVMSGGLIIAVLLSITPFLFPVVMTVLGLLTGMIQAYIFSILAAVYIAAALQDTKQKIRK
jgi:F-type H+-transporting ATPase subunit a